MANFHKKSRVIDTKPKGILEQDEAPDLNEDSGVHNAYFRWALVAAIVVCAALVAGFAHSKMPRDRAVIFLYQGPDRSGSSGIIEGAYSNLGGSVSIELNKEKIAIATNSVFSQVFDLKNGPNVLELSGVMLATSVQVKVVLLGPPGTANPVLWRKAMTSSDMARGAQATLDATEVPRSKGRP
jgi:hypothetical protein